MHGCDMHVFLRVLKFKSLFAATVYDCLRISPVVVTMGKVRVFHEMNNNIVIKNDYEGNWR